jgi:hypothetical protein
MTIYSRNYGVIVLSGRDDRERSTEYAQRGGGMRQLDVLQEDDLDIVRIHHGIRHPKPQRRQGG